MRHEKQEQAMRVLSNLILFLGICFLPIYLWSSGGMQLSHFLLALYCGIFIAQNGIGRGTADAVLLALALFILARESVFAFSGDSLQPLLPAAYIAFNLLIFNVLRRSIGSELTFKYVSLALVVSAAVAVGGVLLIGYRLSVDAEGGRAVGTFNNPNQLGYFSVCLFALVFLLRLNSRISTWAAGFIVLCSVFLAIASLSKAAMIGIGLALLFAGFSFAKGRTAFFLGMAFFVLLAWGLYHFYSVGSFDDLAFLKRLQGLGKQSDDSLEGRGYGAIFSGSALALIFGLGQGGVMNEIGHEVHSTIFNFFVSYGVLGGAAFLAVILMWAQRVWRDFGSKGILLVVAPVMLYGISHNGSRFSIFWILLALSFANLSSQPKVAESRDRPRNRQRAIRPTFGGETM
jgi:O-antigen ligase